MDYMEIFPVIADLWKMDGGVAFGVVPKSIWNRQNMADDNNMMPIVTRCLLIRTRERIILVDAGMGNKRDEKYYNVRFHDAKVSLESSMKEAGIRPEEVTDILFTHLHDDHVGGATVRDANGNPVIAFPNANYFCSRSQWEWAMNPNKREGASFFRDNLQPLQESGRLVLLENECELFPGVQVKIYNGHTMGQLIPYIDFNGKKVVFMGDFIPTSFNIPMPFVPSVDIQPLITMEEKAVFLQEAADRNYILLFEHDYFNECCYVKQTEKGITMEPGFTIASLNTNQHDQN